MRRGGPNVLFLLVCALQPVLLSFMSEKGRYLSQAYNLTGLDLSMMDASSVSVLQYKRSKPLGKVKRRVQDLRVNPSPHNAFTTSAPVLDLSHNEATRLAADSLLSQGLEDYKKVLNAEGEVDFLSKHEKRYILQNGRDGSSDDLGVSDDDTEKDSETLSSSCHTVTHYPTSTDINPPVAGSDPKSLKDVKKTGGFRVYFQSDCRSSGMKDPVREFIRRAEMVLAVVVDSFTDMELLFDFLEASSKRNVSVHLLLDHLNLHRFVSMWQDLKLDSKKFPKLSVRSVSGQTYCAKTGRKLSGQIAESFMIADWKEVLSGSYSFSWLSWHVHRCLVVLLTGSIADGFHQEFHRLYSSSKPVPGFVNCMPLSGTLQLQTTLHSAQGKNPNAIKPKENPVKGPCINLTEEAKTTEAKPKMPILSEIPELASSKGGTQPEPKGGPCVQMHDNLPQLSPRPMVQPPQSAQTEKAKQREAADCTLRDAQANIQPMEKNPDKIQTEVTNVQSKLNNLLISTTAKRNAKVQESNPLQMASQALGSPKEKTAPYQSTPETFSNVKHPNVGTGGLFFQQRNRDGSAQPSGRISAGVSTQRRHRHFSLNLKPNKDFAPDQPKFFSPPATWRHDQPPSRFDWMPLSPTAGPRPVARQNSFNFPFKLGQNPSAPLGWRSSPNSTNPRFGRSKSLNEKHSVGLRGAGHYHN